MPLLAVIIPHLNDHDRLRRCLMSLKSQINDRVEVIVVDNGSSVDLGTLAQDFPWARIINEPSAGAGAARNAGVQNTTAAGLAFLDCDCVAEADWVATALDLSRHTAVFGGQIRLFDETVSARRSGAQAFEQVFGFRNEAYITEKGFSVTANLLTNRRVFETVGPFLTGLSEDLEWCKRARVAGFDLHYAPDLQVRHPTRNDWAALRRKWRRLVPEQFAEQDRRRGRWALRAVLTGLSPLKDTAKVLRSNRIAGPLERAKCLGTLYRLRLARAFWMGRQVLTGRA